MNIYGDIYSSRGESSCVSKSLPSERHRERKKHENELIVYEIANCRVASQIKFERANSKRR